MDSSNEPTSNDDWSVPCSDEENTLNSKNWDPKPEEILQLYTTLQKKGILDLDWQCPGRRSPSVHSAESENTDKKLEDDENSNQRNEVTEFDFDDENADVSSSKMNPRRRGPAPGGSGQKRVASLDKVMFDIRRFRNMDDKSKKLSSSLSFNDDSDK